MVTSTSKNFAPFGSSTKKYGMLTAHPNLDPSGLYKKTPQGCDPCLYSPQPIHKIFEVNKNRKIDKDPWRYKKELEEWAKNLGYRNVKILEYRRWHRTLLGPAWHEVTEPSKYEPACKNVGFGRTPRFRPTKNLIPGPGTYYKAVPYKAPYGPHSTRPTFDREEPCRFKDPSTKWSLAPNRYTILDKDAIDQKPKKIVSLRGPYDLFTGKRDPSNIKNHFNSMKVSAATWPLFLKGSFTQYDRSHFGEMNKTNRDHPYRGRASLVDLAMAYRNPKEPGPANYNVEKPKVFKHNKRAFNSSYDKPPGYQRAIVWPAVGRYKSVQPTCGIIGHGHRHVFLSKAKRTIGAMLPEPMNTF